MLLRWKKRQIIPDKSCIKRFIHFGSNCMGHSPKVPTELFSLLPLLPAIKPRFARKLPRVRFTKIADAPVKRSGITSGNRGWIDVPWARFERGIIRVCKSSRCCKSARGYHDSFYICMHLAAFSRSYKEYPTTIMDYPAVFLRVRGIADPGKSSNRKDKR